MPETPNTPSTSGRTQGLKPCPFCGSGAFFQSDGHDNSSMFYVSCGNVDCFCCVGESYDRDAMPDHIFRSVEDATKAWNTRAVASAGEMRSAESWAEEISRVNPLNIPSLDFIRAIQQDALASRHDLAGIEAKANRQLLAEAVVTIRDASTRLGQMHNKDTAESWYFSETLKELRAFLARLHQEGTP
jgi:hypothetical protein